MAEIDVQSDLKAVTEKMEALVDELNKVNAHREQLVGQVQNLQGVLMYLRGKDGSPEDVDKEVTDGNMPQAVLDAANEAIKEGVDNKGDKDS
jgi:hypothetical protein